MANPFPRRQEERDSWLKSVGSLYEAMRELLDDAWEENNLLKLEHQMMKDALQRFVDRVEKGEVRSQKTYASFKEILATLH